MERGSKTILASHSTLQFKRKKYLSHLPNAIPFQWWMIPTNQIVSNNIQLCKKRLRQSHCVNNIWSRVWGQTEINHVHHPWKMKGSRIKEKSQLGLTSEKCWYPACSNIAVQLSESFHTNPAKTISLIFFVQCHVLMIFWCATFWNISAINKMLWNSVRPGGFTDITFNTHNLNIKRSVVALRQWRHVFGSKDVSLDPALV